MEKLCLYCKHHEFDYEPGSSCPTCGYEAMASMGCQKGRWTIAIGDSTTMEEYRKQILEAEFCPDYDQVELPPNLEVRGACVASCASSPAPKGSASSDN